MERYGVGRHGYQDWRRWLKGPTISVASRAVEEEMFGCPIEVGLSEVAMNVKCRNGESVRQ